MAGGSRLQINFLTEVFRRPASPRSPSLRETRARLRPSRPPQAKQFACSFGTRTKYCAVRRIHFALRRIPIREGFSGASLRAKCLRGGQSPLLWKAGGQSGAEGGTRTPTPLPVLDPESSASANSATSARKGDFNGLRQSCQAESR